MQVKCNGVWLQSFAVVGDLAWSTRSPGGCYEASWRMDLPAGYIHPALVRGARVEIMDGPRRIWQGVLDEPDRSTWTFNASGLCRAAEEYLCLDGFGALTTVPDYAIDAAIGRGLAWTRIDSISSTAFTSTANTLNYLSELLDAVSDEQGKRWTVDEDGVVQMLADPTVPLWHLTPGTVSLGIASDNYASTLFGRYLSAPGTYSTTTASDAAAEAAWGRREEGVDLTGLGVITGTKAGNILTGILTKGKARPGWTNSIETTSCELQTSGGTCVDLSMVEAGQMVRMHGIYDETRATGARTYVDVVIAEARHVDGEDVITLAPMGLVSRTFASITEEALSRGGKVSA